MDTVVQDRSGTSMSAPSPLIRPIAQTNHLDPEIVRSQPQRPLPTTSGTRQGRRAARPGLPRSPWMPISSAIPATGADLRPHRGAQGGRGRLRVAVLRASASLALLPPLSGNLIGDAV